MKKYVIGVDVDDVTLDLVGILLEVYNAEWKDNLEMESIIDWDILFLIPVTWAGPVVAPVLVSIILLAFAVILLYRDCRGRPIRAGSIEWLGFIAAGVVIVVSFCIPGPHIADPDYQSYFYWPLFAAGLLAPIALFVKCLLKSK